LFTPDQRAFDKRQKVTAMSQTIVAFELSEAKDKAAMDTQDPANINEFNDHVHSFSWFVTSNINHDLVFTVISAEVAGERHAGSARFLYADGHVELISSEQIQEWARQPFNFALPPS